MSTKTALIIVDVQNDFLPPDGALAVPGGREIIAPLKQLLSDAWNWKAVIATQDYHPNGHVSFASTHEGYKPLDTLKVTDGWGRHKDHALWPDHCVIGTRGCELDQDLTSSFPPWEGKLKLARKGWDQTVENYSAFEGYLTEANTPSDPPNERIKQTSSGDSDVSVYLRQRGVEKVVVVGLATDFCVNFTALSAIDAGFNTAVYRPCVRGIDAAGCDRAVDGIKKQGGTILEDTEALKNWVE